MLLRESGMPPQDYWETLVAPELILDTFGFSAATRDVVELGCGYGTFTLPLARRIGGTVHAFDIEPAMIVETRNRAAAAGIGNVQLEQRDVFELGYGLPDGACDAALLFNILHAESPVGLLREAARVVRPGGIVAVIHWRSDIQTPRGPSPAIRPTPERIHEWSQEVPELTREKGPFPLPPWHFGLALARR